MTTRAISTALPFPMLRGLMEHYASVDCWCGDDFRGVVASFLHCEPERPQSVETLAELAASGYIPETYRALEHAATMPFAERRAGLVSDLDAVLAAPGETARTALITPLDSRDVVAFTEFWTGDGTAYTGSDPVTAFVRVVRDAAAAEAAL